MGEKEEFIAQMKVRTKKFGVDVIKFVETLKPSKAASAIIYQIVKSSTSVGANYRACCRARSQNEFFSKMCIVVEEADESEFWLEVILEANLSTDEIELQRLLIEASELLKITAAAKNSTYNSKN
jgi:four helix bundle protein